MPEEKNSKYKLILASGSPRRKDLLEQLKVPFEIIVPGIEEKTVLKIPHEVVIDMAKQKGLAVYNKLKADQEFGKSLFPIIIAADTIVVAGNQILGKPKDIVEAKEILLSLAGKSHEVLTGVYLGRWDIARQEYIERTFYKATKVTFSDFDNDLLENYLLTEDSLDKAGAYGIQNALTLIESLVGSYSNVIGFPLTDFINEFKDFLNCANSRNGEWRSKV